MTVGEVLVHPKIGFVVLHSSRVFIGVNLMLLETVAIISMSLRDINVCAAHYCMPGTVLGTGYLEMSE